MLPPPSRPSMETVTPASGVSKELAATARPRNDVVGAVIASVAAADCVSAMPFTLAEAEIERVAVESDWLARAASVRIEV